MYLGTKGARKIEGRKRFFRVREDQRMRENLRELVNLENGKKGWFLSTMECDNQKKIFALGVQNKVLSLESRKKFSESFLPGFMLPRIKNNVRKEKNRLAGKEPEQIGRKNQIRAVQFQMEFAQRWNQFHLGITLEVLSISTFSNTFSSSQILD